MPTTFWGLFLFSTALSLVATFIAVGTTALVRRSRGDRARGPQLTYLRASVPRAGSTYFSHLLWRTGCLGAPLEYLNFESAGPYGFASGSAELQRRLWRSVVRRRCSPNGVF